MSSYKVWLKAIMLFPHDHAYNAHTHTHTGADLSRTVMSHIDRTIFDDTKLLEFARRGCYVEFDLFGVECSHYQVS